LSIWPDSVGVTFQIRPGVGQAPNSPMTKRIVVDPDICNGRPVIAGTRVTAQAVIEFLAAGDSPENILAEYPHLTREGILTCLSYSVRLFSHQPHHIEAF
jgi:uncharacterized protein (DUF433 family)